MKKRIPLLLLPKISSSGISLSRMVTMKKVYDIYILMARISFLKVVNVVLPLYFKSSFNKYTLHQKRVFSSFKGIRY